ncbi:MAG: hypothetical protein ACOVNV_13275, partial [Pirellulaceae bacterium]
QVATGLGDVMCHASDGTIAGAVSWAQAYGDFPNPGTTKFIGDGRCPQSTISRTELRSLGFWSGLP